MLDLRILADLLRRVRVQVSMLAARCVVNRVNDAGSRQVMQIGVLAGEVRDERERFQQYGFTSVPFPGAEVVFLCPQGDREQGVIIAVEDRRYRLTGQAQGECAIHDEQGQKVQIKRTGILVSTPLDVDVEAANAQVTASVSATITAPVISLPAATSIAITAPLVNIQGKGDYKAHVHSDVTPGSSNTGGVV